MSPATWKVWSSRTSTRTAFTLAHSLTLTLAALGVIHLPSRWVEATIAATVCWAAINNLFGWVTRRLWIVACVFGLIHGFGFASVLEELGVPKQLLLVALLAFNAGVELGQLVLVVLFVPLVWSLRRAPEAARWVARAGSLAIALLGFAWLVERALDQPLMAALDDEPESTPELAAELDAARLALQRREWTTAAEKLTRADTLARALDDPRGQAEVQSRSAALHVARGDLRSARAAHERALSTYETLGDDRASAITHRELGFLAQLSGELSLAARAYRRALALHERAGSAKQAADDASALERLYRRTNQTADAEAMAAKARSLTESRDRSAPVEASRGTPR